MKVAMLKKGMDKLKEMPMMSEKAKGMEMDEVMEESSEEEAPESDMKKELSEMTDEELMAEMRKRGLSAAKPMDEMEEEEEDEETVEL
jgi:hypothetical protein